MRKTPDQVAIEFIETWCKRSLTDEEACQLLAAVIQQEREEAARAALAKAGIR